MLKIIERAVNVSPVRWKRTMAVALLGAVVSNLLAADPSEGKIVADAKPTKVDVSKIPPPADRKVDFAKDVQPLLKTACLDCHGATEQMGKFRLDQREAALKGGENGVTIVPGKSAESRLIHYVARLVKDKEMPPTGDSLTKEQVGLLRAWIDQGANW